MARLFFDILPSTRAITVEYSRFRCPYLKSKFFQLQPSSSTHNPCTRRHHFACTRGQARHTMRRERISFPQASILYILLMKYVAVVDSNRIQMQMQKAKSKGVLMICNFG